LKGANRTFWGVSLAWLAGVGSLRAHTLSESISNWQVSGANIRKEFILPDLEAKRLSASGKEMPSSDTIGQYLKLHEAAFSAGRPCALADGPRNLAATPGFSRFEFVFNCPADDDLKISSSAFYERVPTHTNFARVTDSQGGFREVLLTAERHELSLSGADQPDSLSQAGFLRFVAMGMHHIFTGVDHMSFMLGLVLISRRTRDLLFAVTGFTLGHSATLALAVSGILRPDTRYIDALVALTIALIGAENIGDSTHRPLPLALGLGGLLFVMAGAKSLGLDVGLPLPLLFGGGIFAAGYLLLTGQMRDAGQVRLLVTLVFGLIHGFGFAASLLEMRLPPERLAELLVGFNIGVEIGQVTVVLGALLAANLLVRMRLRIPRPLLTDLVASFLVGEGLYWFLGRSVAMG
jgi:hypothetical protein